MLRMCVSVIKRCNMAAYALYDCNCLNVCSPHKQSKSVEKRFLSFFFYWSERYIADVKQYFDIKGVNKIKRKSPNQWWTSATTRRKKKIALPPHNTIPHLTPVHVESALIITATEKDLITMVVERIKADHEMR